MFLNPNSFLSRTLCRSIIGSFMFFGAGAYSSVESCESPTPSCDRLFQMERPFEEIAQYDGVIRSEDWMNRIAGWLGLPKDTTKAQDSTTAAQRKWIPKLTDWAKLSDLYQEDDNANAIYMVYMRDMLELLTEQGVGFQQDQAALPFSLLITTDGPHRLNAIARRYQQLSQVTLRIDPRAFRDGGHFEATENKIVLGPHAIYQWIALNQTSTIRHEFDHAISHHIQKEAQTTGKLDLPSALVHIIEPSQITDPIYRFSDYNSYHPLEELRASITNLSYEVRSQKEFLLSGQPLENHSSDYFNIRLERVGYFLLRYQWIVAQTKQGVQELRRKLNSGTKERIAFATASIQGIPSYVALEVHPDPTSSFQFFFQLAGRRGALPFNLLKKSHTDGSALSDASPHMLLDYMEEELDALSKIFVKINTDYQVFKPLYSEWLQQNKQGKEISNESYLQGSKILRRMHLAPLRLFKAE